MFKTIVMISLVYCASMCASAGMSAQAQSASNAQNYPRFTYLMVGPQMLSGFIPRSLIFNPKAMAAIAAIKSVQGMPYVAIDATPSEIPQIKRALPQIEAAFREKMHSKFGDPKVSKPQHHLGYLLTRAGEIEPIDEHFAIELRYGGKPMIVATGPVDAPEESANQTALSSTPQPFKKHALQFPKYPCFVGMHSEAEPPFPLNVPTTEISDFYKTFDNVMNTFRVKFDKTFVDQQTKKPRIETHGYLFMPSGEIIPTNYTELLLFGRVTFTGQDVERVKRLKAQGQVLALKSQTATALEPHVAASPDFKALAEADLLEKQRQEKELKELQDEYEAQERIAHEYLKHDYLVIPNPLGGWKCQPVNVSAEEREKIAKWELQILSALNKRFSEKFGRPIDNPCMFTAQGNIQPMQLKVAKVKFDDKKIAIKGTQHAPLQASALQALTQKAVGMQQRLHEKAEALKQEAERLKVVQEELSKQRKAERNKKKRQRAKQKEAQSKMPVASAAPATSADSQVPKVASAQDLLEKERQEKEAAANKKEAERLLAAQQALVKHKLVQKQKQGKLYAHVAGEQADELVDALADCNKQLVRIKKFGTPAEKTELAEKYQSIAGRLTKLNHEKSAEAQAKYDELQGLNKQASRKKK